MTHRSRVRVGSAALLTLALVVPAGSISAQEDTTITFLTPPWGGPPDQALFDAFQADSGITVEVVEKSPIDVLFQDVQVAAAAGLPAADVIFLTEDAPSNIIATGNVEPLDDLIASNGTDMSVFDKVDFWQQDGAQVGIPVYSQLVMMDYNTAKLAEAGIDVAPTTWAELDEQARAIKEQGVEDYPISFGAIDWSWYLMSLSRGDPMFDDELNPVFADEGSGARAAMAQLLTWFADELISPAIVGGEVTQHANFWGGTGTFHQGWQGSVRVGNNPEVSTQAPNVAYLLLPDAHFTWSQPAALGIGTGSPNRDAAYEFIEWYTSPENQVAIYDAFGLYPSRSEVAAQLNDDGKIEGYDVIVEQAEFVDELPREALWWGPFTQAVSAAILEAASTGGDPDAVVDQLAEEWNSLKSEFS
jgi:multiple sugar transport system substrate-binding protein